MRRAVQSVVVPADPASSLDSCPRRVEFARPRPAWSSRGWRIRRRARPGGVRRWRTAGPVALASGALKGVAEAPFQPGEPCALSQTSLARSAPASSAEGGEPLVEFEVCTAPAGARQRTGDGHSGRASFLSEKSLAAASAAARRATNVAGSMITVYTNGAPNADQNQPRHDHASRESSHRILRATQSAAILRNCNRSGRLP